MAKLGKAIKLNIASPINCDWKELYDAYNHVAYVTPKMLNYCMTQLFIWQQRKEDIKAETGKYPTLKELPISNPYKELTEMYPEISSKSIAQIIRTAQLRWKTDTRACYYAMDKSLPSYKKTFGFPVSNQGYKIYKKDDKYFVDATLFSRKYEGDIKRFTIEIYTKKLKGGQKAILDRLVSKEYKAGTMTIKMDKKRHLQLVTTYTFEKQPLELDKDIVCGIDLGVAIPVYCALNNGEDRWWATDGFEIEKFRRSIAFRRRQIQRQYPLSGRIGRGRVHALKPLQKLSDKVDNFRNNKYHLYTKRIIEFCIKNNAGTIQLEDLSSLTKAKESDSFLKDWAISDLHTKLKYKAEEAGIEVKFISPKYTSQMCHECGYISRDNRKTQSEFVCQKCGCVMNADHNAAKNIANPDIEERVKENLANGNNDKKKVA